MGGIDVHRLGLVDFVMVDSSCWPNALVRMQDRRNNMNAAGYSCVAVGLKVGSEVRVRRIVGNGCSVDFDVLGLVGF